MKDGDASYLPLRGGETVPIDAGFMLLVTSELKSPRFSPEIAVFANLVNFSVTEEGLETALLSEIISEKMAGLEKMHNEKKVDALNCVLRLKQSE